MFLLDLSTHAINKALKSVTFIETAVTVLPKRNKLSEDEEIQICSLTREQLYINNCISETNIGDIVGELCKKRTEVHAINCSILAKGINNSRSNISFDEVETYLTLIDEMMKDPFDPLPINFDETGFGKRPEKGECMYVYIHQNCSIKASSRENTDAYHISVV
ncbi:hypothetical protein TRFO_37038 [Tritrichomonas foetus]|uniref:Uncharacterized protein n=1 Tax=Tritrichomonas foetus TaxID=1144522 RepID=A0A1J4JC26_9EUKA|nr:hypothetical protein TRFO_37038 [Tritrichomonas foetus]|eukprot:OHS96754.1 hypothetical protein TRFO_37038 [Tritrichomonas foetus]